MLHRINVKTVSNAVLQFRNVLSYEITKGDYVEFIDSKTKIPQKFHASNCDIMIEKEVNPSQPIGDHSG